VTASTNPLFNDLAITTISRWRYRAGMKKGKYVAARMAAPLVIRVG